MLQSYRMAHAVDSLGHNAVADAAGEQAQSVAHITAIGDGCKVVSVQLPTAICGGGLNRLLGRLLFHRQSFCAPNLQVVQLTAVQRMTAGGAQIAEAEVLTGNPVGGGLLIRAVDIVVVHSAQLSAVYTQVNHIGAIGCDLVGQAVGMLSSAVNAVIAGTDAVVTVRRTVPVAEGDELAVLVAEQEGRVGDAHLAGIGQQHRAALEIAGGLPLHNPGLIVLQSYRMVHAVDSLGHHAVADAASEQAQSVAHIAVTGDGCKVVSVQLPAVASRRCLNRILNRLLHFRLALCPNLHIIQLAVIQRMTIRANVAEGKVLTGNPVGGGFLRSCIDVVVIHGAQLFTVHAQVNHVGAIVCNLVGQTVSMLSSAVNAVISQTDAIVAVRRTVPVANGDELAVFVAEQEGGIGDPPGSGGGQQHGAITKATGRLPFHDPRLVMLQDHTAAEVENRLVHGAVGKAAMEHRCLIEHIAAIGDGGEFITLELPAVIVCACGAHGRIVNIAFEVADTVMIGIGSGSATIGSKVKLSGGGTDCAVFHFKQAGKRIAGDEEGQRRIVSEIAGSAFQIINYHCALVDGLHIGIAGQGQKELPIVIVKALLGKGRQIGLLAIHLHIGNIQCTQLGQFNGAAGSGRIQSTGIQRSAGLNQNLDLRIAGSHNLHCCHAGSGSVIGRSISSCRGQLGAVDRQTH